MNDRIKKQIVVISDMEGASGIFDSNRESLVHGSKEWNDYGKGCLTSDFRAVCEAAFECGIDEIFYYDSHYAGCKEPNVIVSELSSKVIFADVEDRCFYWRRIRGQADNNPVGIITIGQHSRFGEENSYFGHTIQSPPIKAVRLNGIHIAEIGFSVLNFHDVPYVANVGCAASESEAKELNPNVTHISCKSKKDRWEPSPEITYPIIKEGIKIAIDSISKKTKTKIEAPYIFEMEVFEEYRFKENTQISWKGTVSKHHAVWESPDIEIGLELFNYVRELIEKV